MQIFVVLMEKDGGTDPAMS